MVFDPGNSAFFGDNTITHLDDPNNEVWTHLNLNEGDVLSTSYARPFGSGSSSFVGPTQGGSSNNSAPDYRTSNQNSFSKDLYLYAVSLGDDASNLSTALGLASSLKYNETFGFWLGKNGKFYNFNFNGNGFTGGRNAFAKNGIKGFKIGTGILDAYSIWSTNENWKLGHITTSDMVEDQAINGIGFMGLPGAAFSTTWSTLDNIQESSGFQIQIPWNSGYDAQGNYSYGKVWENWLKFR